MNAEKLDQMWESSIVNADKKTVFGFQNIPMKTWTLMTGECLENELLWSNKEVSLKIENLTVNGEKFHPAIRKTNCSPLVILPEGRIRA